MDLVIWTLVQLAMQATRRGHDVQLQQQEQEEVRRQGVELAVRGLRDLEEGFHEC